MITLDPVVWFVGGTRQGQAYGIFPNTWFWYVLEVVLFVVRQIPLALVRKKSKVVTST